MMCVWLKLFHANNVSSQKTIIYLLRLIGESFSCVQIWEEKPNTTTMHVVETYLIKILIFSVPFFPPNQRVTVYKLKKKNAITLNPNYPHYQISLNIN